MHSLYQCFRNIVVHFQAVLFIFLGEIDEKSQINEFVCLFLSIFQMNPSLRVKGSEIKVKMMCTSLLESQRGYMRAKLQFKNVQIELNENCLNNSTAPDFFVLAFKTLF